VPAGTAFSGQVVATVAGGDEVAAHTGFALHKERELYDYTIKLTGRDGKPAAGYVGLTYEGNRGPFTVAVDGTTTLRLPPGTYTAWCWLDVEGDRADSLGSALLTAPETVLADEATVNLDASKARKVSAAAPRETETGQTIMDFRRSYADGTGNSGIGFDGAFVLPPTYDSVYAAPTEKVTKGMFGLLTRWRLREKFLDAETGDGRAVELTGQAGTAFKDGDSNLKTVYAGKGAAADYAGINAKGKAVLVTRSDEVTALERAEAATAAGAAMLISVNDDRGRLYEGYQKDDDSSQSLTIASAMRLDGRRLIDQATSGHGKLKVKQKRFADYVYDLIRRHDGAIPDRSLAYTPSHKDLAKVTNTFYGDKQTLGAGFRYYVPAWGRGVGWAEYESFPDTRTEYVSPQAGDDVWYEDHQTGTDVTDIEQRGALERYRAGRGYAGKWFQPVQAPRLGSGYWGPFRQQYDSMQFNIPMWSDSGEGHTGSMPEGEYDTGKIALYQGDKLLKSVAGRATHVGDLPKEKLPYRLVLTGSRDPEKYRTSVQTRTEWGFVSEALPPTEEGGPWQEDLDLLNLTYDVDTDIAGEVRAGRGVELGLGSATYPGDVKAKKATLQVSYDDGATWRPVKLSRDGDGRWTAQLRTPDTRGGAVSLRAGAEGPGGLTVEQEVIRAFRLR
jgi:hypothetical protein